MDELRKAADDGELTKYFDVNLTQLFKDRPRRDTLEIRILPGATDAAEIVNRAALIELLLDRCEEPDPFPLDPAADVSAEDPAFDQGQAAGVDGNARGAVDASGASGEPGGSPRAGSHTERRTPPGRFVPA